MKPMTPAECAERANVSRSLIYAVLRDGRLPAMRVGCRGRGKWLVEPEAFDGWLQSCRLIDLRAEDEGELSHLRK